jgi:hypothetical protein
MKGIKDRLLFVFGIILCMCAYIGQAFLWGALFDIWFDNIGNMSSFNFGFWLIGILPIGSWVIIGIYSLISWIITNKVYTLTDYKYIYEKRKLYKSNKAREESGGLSIVSQRK